MYYSKLIIHSTRFISQTKLHFATTFYNLKRERSGGGEGRESLMDTINSAILLIKKKINSAILNYSELSSEDLRKRWNKYHVNNLLSWCNLFRCKTRLQLFPAFSGLVFFPR
jgi:hypothetical protein